MKENTQCEIAEKKYRPLKKRLRVPYKKIQKSLEQGILPDAAVVADFMTLTQIMTGYSGFGDPFYHDFTSACRSFEKAYRKNSLPGIQESFRTIMKIKHGCHNRD